MRFTISDETGQVTLLDMFTLWCFTVVPMAGYIAGKEAGVVGILIGIGVGLVAGGLANYVLNSFSFFLDGIGGSATGYVMEWNVDRTIGPILFQSTPQVIGPSGLFEYTFNTGNLVLVQGEEYIIFVDAGDVFQDPLAFRIGILGGVEPDAFPGGHLALSGGAFPNSFAQLSTVAWDRVPFEGNDAAFTASFSSVPEPATLTLLAAGLLAGGLFRKRWK